MKLRNIITSLFAAAAVLVGCQKQETLQLSEVQVDCSYVALNVGGSSATVNVTANDSWTISGAPAWLTVSPTSGAAGTTQILQLQLLTAAIASSLSSAVARPSTST